MGLFAMRDHTRVFHCRIVMLLVCFYILHSCPRGFAESSLDKAYQLYQQRQFAAAASAFEQSLKTQQNLTIANPVNVRYYWADALYRSGQTQRALQIYHQVYEAFPNTQAGRYSKTAIDRLTAANAKTSVWTRATGVNAASTPGKTTTNAKVNSIVLSTKTGTTASNYLDKVTYAGYRVRWSGMPVPVFIDTHPDKLRNFSPALLQQVQQSLETWQQASGGLLKIKLVSTPAQARILVRWVNQLDQHGVASESGTRFTSGATVPTIENSQLKHMDVRLAVLDYTGKPLNLTQLGSISLHEFGHALGLLGHSDQATDIMFAEHRDKASLSPRDIQTIEALYRLPAQISELPARKLDLNDPIKVLEQAAIQAQQLNEIRALEQAVQQAPTSPSLNQLADLYRRQGDRTSTAKERSLWLQKALATIDKSIQLNPQDGWSYFNQAVLFGGLNQWATADASITKAIALVPDTASLYLEQVKIKTALKQLAEAKNAMENFKHIATPTEQTDPIAINTQKSLIALEKAKTTTKPAQLDALPPAGTDTNPLFVMPHRITKPAQ